MTHDAAVDVKGYLAVFGALLVLTLLTVGVSTLHLAELPAVLVGIAIAIAKAALVALFFMHLRSERAIVYWALGFTGFFFVALLALVLLSEGDHLFGTRFGDAFQMYW